MKSLILLGSACDDVKMNKTPESLEYRKNKTIDWVRQISSHAVDWAEAIQELSWPECATELAEERLWKKKPATADEAASIVRRAYEDTGPKAWGYQTLAHPGDWVPERHYAVRAINGTYANVTNAEGWTVHVFRYNFVDPAFCKRVEQAKIRLQEEDYAVKRALRNSLDVSRGRAELAIDRYFAPIGLVSEDAFSGSFFLMDNPMHCEDHAIVGNCTLEACPTNGTLSASQELIENHWFPWPCQYRAYHLMV
ncbi:unnamed protein product, partial [Mesorhabditis spiculigera]